MQMGRVFTVLIYETSLSQNEVCYFYQNEFVQEIFTESKMSKCTLSTFKGIKVCVFGFLFSYCYFKIFDA